MYISSVEAQIIPNQILPSSFGTLGAVSYLGSPANVNFKYRDGIWISKKGLPVRLLHNASAFIDVPFNGNEIEHKARRMLDQGIPLDFNLGPSYREASQYRIIEDLKHELSEYKGDVYAGNPCSLCEFGGRKYLVHTSGYKSNIMNLTRIDDTESVKSCTINVKRSHTYDIQTTALLNVHKLLVTCRFYDGSGFYLLDGDNNIEDFTLSSTSSKDKIKHRPVKICINPYHNTFCDLLLSNGELQSCEVGTFTSHRTPPISHPSLDNAGSRWIGLDYGLNPNTLLLGKSFCIFMVDKRVNNIQIIHKSKDRIGTFAIDRSNPIQLALLNEKTTSLLDLRLPSTPISRWEHNQGVTNGYGIIFPTAESGIMHEDIFFSWHRSSNALIGYRRGCETIDSFASKIPVKYGYSYPPLNLFRDLCVETGHNCTRSLLCELENCKNGKREIVSLLGAQAEFESRNTFNIYSLLDSQSIWKLSYEAENSDEHGNSSQQHLCEHKNSFVYPEPCEKISNYTKEQTRSVDVKNFNFAIKFLNSCSSGILSRTEIKDLPLDLFEGPVENNYTLFEIVKNRFNTNISYEDGIPQVPELPLITTNNYSHYISILNGLDAKKLQGLTMIPEFTHNINMRRGFAKPRYTKNDKDGDSLIVDHTLLSRIVFMRPTFSYTSANIEEPLSENMRSWALNTKIFDQVFSHSTDSATVQSENSINVVEFIPEKILYPFSPFTVQLEKLWNLRSALSEPRCSAGVPAYNLKELYLGKPREHLQVPKVTKDNSATPKVYNVDLIGGSKTLGRTPKSGKRKMGF